MTLPPDISMTPTREKLLELYPIGSVVSREAVGDAFILLSPSLVRISKNRGSGTGKKLLSIPASRRLRGIVFFKEMVKKGYWKEE